MFENIKIILVQTSHPGNIGSVARAMKTMGLKHLYLVNPKNFPNVDATAMAAGADDILSSAIIFSSLNEAIKNCQIIFGTSARFRNLNLSIIDPKKAAYIINNYKKNNVKIAIIFGREDNGLTNEEVSLCNYLIHVPTNQQFSSLNISQAVQIIVYEIASLYKNFVKNNNLKLKNCYATFEEMENFYQYLFQILVETNFLKQQSNNKKLFVKIKCLFSRSQLTIDELNIIRGIIVAINTKYIKK